MSSTLCDQQIGKTRSISLQTNLCSSPSCSETSQVVCHHCSEKFCQFCFMCHRKNVLDDMQMMTEQMSTNRRDGISEVVSFIDNQAKDAHDQAKKLIDDAIDRIVRASKNIYTYIENRRQAKLSRLDECLEKFDKDAELLQSKLKSQVFLPAETMLQLRSKYAYNMFDTVTSAVSNEPTESQRKNEKFFDNYRHYKEFVNLREKWPFLQPALTTVYYPMKKDISLDKILTFLEYRHDRVLENYREHLATKTDTKELSLKSAEALLNELSFLVKKQAPLESDNFSYIGEPHSDINVQEHQTCLQTTATQEIKQEVDATSKTDSGQGDEVDGENKNDDEDDDDDDDDVTSNSSESWQLDEAEEDDYDLQFMKLSQSMKLLEQQFENDFRPFAKKDLIH